MGEIGPLQLIFIHFDQPVVPPLVHAQIDDLRRRGLMRLADSVVAVKGDDGALVILDTLDAPRGDPLWSGVLARSFFGAGCTTSRSFDWEPTAGPQLRPPPELSVTEDQLLEIADLIPTNSRTLILLIEHSWTVDLEIAAVEGEGHVLANCWITPAMLTRLLRRERALLTEES